MKLYHATDYENTESIIETGLIPTDGGVKVVDPERATLQGKGLYGVYGFVSIEDAKVFSNDNYGDGVIFEFDADSVIDDPEFDGEAKFALCDEPIPAVLVWEQWN
jgi:hypothetical protein